MKKHTELKLVHKNTEQPLSEALIRAIVLENDAEKAAEIVKRINSRAKLTSVVNRPESLLPHQSGE